ncbi:hypothetical protein GCM10011409_26440 [Lentibacillus populi]|uniref:Uncharacterized protein n=1 Tax=Lentibacillus populi TaxID=1827502 RepID=A0A9W5TYJ5_9BACI|nr:hypothetical protein [Lentibacillus populi]GGB47659.1 hypothetical protein GCM10011409_26440 [Lentibacillus populi]
MNVVHWYDWITPTNPFVAVLLSMLLILGVAIIAWFEDTKNFKTPILILITGFIFSIVGVFFLHSIGFYK